MTFTKKFRLTVLCASASLLALAATTGFTAVGPKTDVVDPFLDALLTRVDALRVSCSFNHVFAFGQANGHWVVSRAQDVSGKSWKVIDRSSDDYYDGSAFHATAARAISMAQDPSNEALYVLGEMKWRGGMVPQDIAQGRELFRRAGALGHAGAAHIFTNLLANGVAGNRDWPQAIARLREEAKSDRRRRQMLDTIERMSLDAEGDPLSVPEPERLSEAPHVMLFPRLLAAAECDYLKQLAEPGYVPSTVYDAERRLQRDPIRTSDGSTIHWQIEDPLVHVLNRRLAAATGSRAEQGEALQILRYRPGQQYRNHFDFVQSSDNQRFQTALVYLNHDYRGGETCFVRTGLKVKGRKGDALIFRSALPDRTVDPLSEHAGLPVTSGTKRYHPCSSTTGPPSSSSGRTTRSMRPPTGMTITPPGASCATSSPGSSRGWADTRIRS